MNNITLKTTSENELKERLESDEVRLIKMLSISNMTFAALRLADGYLQDIMDMSGLTFKHGVKRYLNAALHDTDCLMDSLLKLFKNGEQDDSEVADDLINYDKMIERLRQLIEIGVLAETDEEFIKMISAAKNTLKIK